jgi:hypothetical protein
MPKTRVRGPTPRHTPKLQTLSMSSLAPETLQGFSYARWAKLEEKII